MLKKDYLLAQIEELAKKFAMLIEKKEKMDPDVRDFTDECYGILGISPEWLANAEPEEIISRIGIWDLIELLVKIMTEDDNMNTKRDCMQKAQVLLFYVQKQCRTYSEERIKLENKIEELMKSLA
ncbi:MAG: hypothetical protein RRY55_03870 [Bacteroidales bacterium]